MTTDATETPENEIIESGEPLEKIIEGLLFVAPEPVTIGHLAEAAECSPAKVETTLASLQQANQLRGVRVQRQGKKVQMVSAPELTAHIERFLGLTVTGRLSTPALETLAIIAYRQPITRPQIEAIRGVNSDGVLRTLVSKGLAEEVGRLDSVGHPALFGTTFEFLRYFGLESMDELPELDLPQIQFPTPPEPEPDSALSKETE
jgi:segregation and condensation protein B